MHNLYFVRLKEKENALNRAFQILEGNNFASNGGYFSSSKSDWFTVGGRWSGMFTRELKKKEYNEALKEAFDLYPEYKDKADYLYINEHLIDENKREGVKKNIDKIFIKKTGYPYFRDKNGYKDDCIEITDEVLKLLKTDEYKDVEVCLTDEDEMIEEETMAGELGEKSKGQYLVVIDYHY